MNDLVKATLIRTVRQFCFTATGCIGSAVVLSDVDWKYVLSACILSCIVTALTCIATGLPEVESASELTEEEVADEEVVDYDDSEYDDLYVDDEVEDDELEQEE